MKSNLAQFESAYKKWVDESLFDFQAGHMEQIVKKYPFMISEEVPWTQFEGKVSEKTFALITSGGLYLKDSQSAFETKTIHGDPSFRKIPKTVRAENIGIAHSHYDQNMAEKDINTIFPFQRFLELEKEGIIGKVADSHYSFSYVNDVSTLISTTIPKVIQLLKSESVDALFLVPVRWHMRGHERDGRKVGRGRF